MTVKIPLRLITHEKRIASLYKTWLRLVQGSAKNIEDYRYKSAFVRCEFDAIYNEKDMRKSKQMLLDKENEVSDVFAEDPIYFAFSPNGTAYQREPVVLDWLLDNWNPLEKAIYPEYFKRRELRKQQFIEMWDKQHGPPPPTST